MLNNIGLPGLLILLAIIVLPFVLLSRNSRKKRENQERIAQALEDVAKNTGSSLEEVRKALNEGKK